MNIAITKKSGWRDFNESGALLGEKDSALVSTFHKSEMDRFKKVEYNKVKVSCLKWATFADAYPKSYDFISIDVEGCEMEILPHMDLSKTRMVCIEWNTDPTKRTQYEEYLKGFKLIDVNQENLIYAK